MFLIASGGFGCLIDQPVIDKKSIVKTIIPYKNIKQNDVSKIFKVQKKEIFDFELKIGKQMNKIDANNDFTVKLKGAHWVKYDTFTDYRIKRCIDDDKYFVYDKICYQLIMENGGVPIDQVTDKISYKKFISMLQVFLKGMIKFQKSNLVHNDIKPDNVLFNNKKISLIDFSLLSKLDHVYSKKSLIRKKKYKYFYAPEYYIYYIVCEKKVYTDKKSLLNHLDIINFYDKSFFEVSLNRKKFKDQIEDFLDILFQSGNKLDHIFDKQLALKADVFSFSYILDAFINLQIVVTNNNKEKGFLTSLLHSTQHGNPLKRESFKSLHNIVSLEYKRLFKTK